VIAVAVLALAGCGSGGTSGSATGQANAANDPAAYEQGVVAAEKEMVATGDRTHVSLEAEEDAEESAVSHLVVSARLAAYAIDLAWDRDLISNGLLPKDAARELVASFETGKSEPSGSAQYGQPTPGLGPFLANQGARLQAEFERTVVYAILAQCARGAVVSAELSDAPAACNLDGASLGLYPAAPSPEAVHECASAIAAAQQIPHATSQTKFVQDLRRFLLATIHLVKDYPAASAPFASAAEDDLSLVRNMYHRVHVPRTELSALNSAIGKVQFICTTLPDSK
jgi:hypothetical protein